MAKDCVPNDLLRAAFESSGLTPNQVAARLGWVRSDGQRVRSVLGLKRRVNRHGTPGLQGAVEYETAVEIAKALEVEPHEVGL